MAGIFKPSRAFVLVSVTAFAAFASLGSSHAKNFQVLHYFIRHEVEGKYDGINPRAGVVMDKQGNLYGTTEDGGGADDDFHGVVFKLAPDGTETVLFAFPGDGHLGEFPFGELIADIAGNLYGTTIIGGGPGCDGEGCGTVFRVAPDGTETTLHAFTGGHDGGYPLGGLLLDDQGNLYGTTVNNGGKHCSGFGCGVVFRVAPGGTETVLYAFKGGDDGASPLAGLIMDDAGNLYGTTEYGGTGCFGEGCGTVYKLAPDGKETVLYRFAGGSDGTGPFGRLLADKAGNLYGTTYGGGGSGCSGNGCGTVFKLAPDRTETILYSFAGGGDGENPGASLIADGAGNLYGTTIGGGEACGVSYCGTAFKLAPDGTKTVLHSFAGRRDGGGVYGNLILDDAGNLYGATFADGRSCHRGGCGTVFEITP